MVTFHSRFHVDVISALGLCTVEIGTRDIARRQDGLSVRLSQKFVGGTLGVAMDISLCLGEQENIGT